MEWLLTEAFVCTGNFRGYLNLVGQELILVLWVIKAIAIHLRSSLSANTKLKKGGKHVY